MTRMALRLSGSGVASLSQGLRAYADELAIKADFLAATIADEGADTARSVVPVDTGDLKASIGIEGGDGSYEVAVENDHAAFVEFGTGVQGHDYEGELPDIWEYGIGEHILQDGSWFYPDPDVKEGYTRTWGQPSSGYMAAAAEAMKQAVPAAVKEVFG